VHIDRVSEVWSDHPLWSRFVFVAKGGEEGEERGALRRGEEGEEGEGGAAALRRRASGA
jgi:hypothetical protein